jgi:hypothetical protein
MKYRIAFGALLAVALVFSVTVTAMAAGPGYNGSGVAGAGLADPGTGLSEAFVDVDGDGTCDSYELRTPLLNGSGLAGTGAWWANDGQPQAIAPQAGFAGNDADGLTGPAVSLGAAPQDGTGNRYQRGGRWN